MEETDLDYENLYKENDVYEELNNLESIEENTKELFKDFNLKKKLFELVNAYCNPPFDWSCYEVGIFKYNEHLNGYAAYTGQGYPAPLYDGNVEYNINLTEVTRNHFEGYEYGEKISSKVMQEYVNDIYENVLDEIIENEEELQEENRNSEEDEEEM